MIALNKLDHLNLNVINLDKSQKFYEDVFGLELKEEGVSSLGNAYRILGKPDSLYLCLYENLEKPQEGPSYLNHLGVNVSNFDEVKDKLIESGIKINYGGSYVEYDLSRSLYIEDPNGIEIEISEVFGGGLN